MRGCPEGIQGEVGDGDGKRRRREEEDEGVMAKEKGGGEDRRRKGGCHIEGDGNRKRL